MRYWRRRSGPNQVTYFEGDFLLESGRQGAITGEEEDGRDKYYRGHRHLKACTLQHGTTARRVH
eukprot:scaffold5006_cov102-Skeletonema_dohrnii-CCMP3373.AAC.1